MSDGVIDVTCWGEADADRLENIEHIIDMETIDGVQYDGSYEGEDMVRITAVVSEEGTKMDYTIDLSESVIKQATEELKKSQG